MQFLQLLDGHPALLIIFGGTLGLLVGSFLNVVIYRLPIMLERGWKRECEAFLAHLENPDDEPQPTKEEEKFNLLVPASRCPHCEAEIKPWQNIPVISYLRQRGKCANCGGAISAQYPLVELLTAVLSAMVALRFGGTVQMLAMLVLTWSLIALSGIDIKTKLLPDVITLPLLWLGLVLSLSTVFVDAETAIAGAAVGYGALWLIFQLFKLITGKEGMGYGDFKLMAVFGAWAGWQALPFTVFMSSIVGAVVGIAILVITRSGRNTQLPFGPYIAAAGWIYMMWGDAIVDRYLNMFAM